MERREGRTARSSLADSGGVGDGASSEVGEPGYTVAEPGVHRGAELRGVGQRVQ